MLETSNSRIEVEELHLEDLSSVRRFAEKMKGKLDHLDILVNNAGKTELSCERTNSYCYNYVKVSWDVHMV